MTQGNMGLWDKITGNNRHYDGEMRMQWREPSVSEPEPLAGQRDPLTPRVSQLPAARRDLSVRTWKRGRHM